MWQKLSLVGLLIVLAGNGTAAEQAKRSDSVVKIRATASEPAADGMQAVTIDLAIDKGWHLYANPVPTDFPGIPTTVKVGGNVKADDVKIVYPAGKLVKDAVVGDHQVYEDKATIKATVRRAKGDSGPLELIIQVQACTDKQCLLPATVKVTTTPTK